ncbi:MAG: heavy metal translocating P-type ATPase [Deltaproteobacteria bacterium]|nr:heavy metal translocating P-type ATPase [Deltaproteobacteria bacterium]
MNKHKLDLQIILPQDAADCDACVKRLLDTVRGRSGIVDAHIDSADTAKTKLCLHYDPAIVRLQDVQAVVHRAGAELSERFEHLSIPVVGLRHERQANLVEGVFARQVGVLHAGIAFGARRLYIEFDPKQTSRESLMAVAGAEGISAAKTPAAPPRASGHDHDHDHDHSKENAHAHEHEHGGPFGERSELVFSLGCGALTAVGWGLGRGSVPAIVPTALFAVAYVLGAWFTVQEVAVALRAKRFEIDFLMLFAAVGAAVLGQWFEGALLLFLFTLGHALEGYAMGRARKAIEALSQLVPQTALRLGPSHGIKEVPVSELVVGDTIMVKPNTRIAADGFVVAGSSSVNQAPITGESVPVDKIPVPDAKVAAANASALAPENRVFAGTINGAAALTILVTKAAADSTLARVVKMVAEAETQKSATQRFTDRFERVFVPVILGVVVLLLFAPFVIDETFAHSFYRAMAVLVSASPCALAIATPSAVLSGVARAARGGVLIKGGAHLETLGAITAIAFDKTGTLTEGKPQLTDVLPTQGTTETELMQTAVAVESQSDHPLAAAIVNGAASRLPAEIGRLRALNVKALVGFGVKAEIDGATVLLGKPGLFTNDGALPDEVTEAIGKLQSNGRTVMVVKSANRFLGVLGLMDTPRDTAREVISELHRLGIKQSIMLTGDNQSVADAVAGQVGIRVARGDLLPEQKVAVIVQLAGSSTGVAMVGDGVNDAPAMANATVGIAMGAGGSDVALETADIALMADDLRALPFAVGLSRASRSIIRQNLWASLGMVAILIPATIFGFAGIGVAVALHEGSTLLVVVNALRLLAYKDQRAANPGVRS